MLALIERLRLVRVERAGVGGTVFAALIESGLEAFGLGTAGASDAATEAASRVVDVSRRLRALNHCFVCFITSCWRPNRFAICSSRSLGIATPRVLAIQITSFCK